MKTAMSWVLAAVTAAALIAACWFGYWALDRQSITNRYNNDTHNQQYQSGLVAQERDRVQGYDTATDPAQKAQIKATFCQVYPTLDPPPADLVSAHARIC